jgi:flagellar protein FlbD
VIILTRLGGPVFALNPDLVERADCTPDTIITLVDGKRYVVAESLPEVITLIRQFRATVVADAQQLSTQQEPRAGTRGGGDRVGAAAHNGNSTDKAPTNVVRLPRRER